MKSINRSAMVVTPAAPFIEWVRHVDEEAGRLLPEEIVSNPSVYLLPEFDGEDELLAYLEQVSSAIFEQELESWHEDPQAWPPERDVIELRRWFHISLHSVIVDVAKGALKREPW